MITILLVVAIFGLLVFVHELGHFVAARLAGIEVEEFGFGFPPRVAGIQKGRTLYSINLIPLGGFVRLQGEDQADNRKGCFGSASFGAKVAVLLAGVAMNALVAYVLLLVLAVTGVPSEAVKDFGISGGQGSAPRVIAITIGSESPAGKAGIQKGDVLVSASVSTFEDDDQQTFTSEDQVISFMKRNAGKPIRVETERAGKPRSVDLQLRSPEEGVERGYLGVSPMASYLVRFGWQSPLVAAELLIKAMGATVVGFFGVIAGLVSKGQVSENVVGPVGVVGILDQVLIFGWRYVVFFITSISISLAVINALPIPALDGGRLMLVVARKILRRPLSAELEAKIHAVGFIALLVFMAIITIFDIQRVR